MAVCFLQDMTTMYLALAQQRKMVQAIERIEETVVLSDGQGRIFYANPSALRNSGYTFEEVVGQPISLFAAPESAFTVAGPAFMEFMRSGHWRGDIMACTKDGKRYPVEVIGSLVRDDDGKPGMFVIVSRKIEERQRYEAELLLARRHMEYVKEVLEHNLRTVLDKSLALLDRCAEDGLRPAALRKARAALDSEVASALAETQRVTSVEPDLKNARTLKPIPLSRILKERVPALADRIGAERFEVDFKAEDDDITVMANDLLPELLARLVRVIMKLSPPGKVHANVLLRRVHGPRGTNTSGEVPGFAELSTHVPGLQLTDEVRGILSRRDMPFRVGGEGDELSVAAATTSLLVLIYGGQSYIEDVDPDRPELGVRFTLLLPLAGRPPKPPSAPVPVEELGASKRKRGRGKGS
jgi:PAS domain S-box-containing protein